MSNAHANYTVDDDFGNQIATGLRNRDEALAVARRYLAAHKDAPCVEIYGPGGYDSGAPWIPTREELGV